MGKLTSYRLKANTILETIVASVIILVIFGIATTIFVRAGAVSNSVKKMKAEALLKEYATDTQERQLFFDSQEAVDSFEIRRQVAEMNGFRKLWRIHYSIYDRENILLAEWQQYARAE